MPRRRKSDTEPPGIVGGCGKPRSFRSPVLAADAGWYVAVFPYVLAVLLSCAWCTLVHKGHVGAMSFVRTIFRRRRRVRLAC